VDALPDGRKAGGPRYSFTLRCYNGNSWNFEIISCKGFLNVTLHWDPDGLHSTNGLSFALAKSPKNKKTRTAPNTALNAGGEGRKRKRSSDSGETSLPKGSELVHDTGIQHRFSINVSRIAVDDLDPQWRG